MLIWLTLTYMHTHIYSYTNTHTYTYPFTDTGLCSTCGGAPEVDRRAVECTEGGDGGAAEGGAGGWSVWHYPQGRAE